MNIVMAINMGGDDFIAKPFDLNVLTAKVQALLRRTYDFAVQSEVLECGGALLCGKKNPLLSAKRRRGDANVVWDIPPIERRRLDEIERALRELLGGEWEGE